MTQPGYLSLVHTSYQPNWIVRTAGRVDALPRQMQRAFGSVAPGLPFSGFYSMSDLQAQTLATQRIQLALLGTMAALALLLSAIGIFSLVASSVTQCTREFGIRIALGAPTGRVMAHAANVGMLPAGAGLFLGLIGCMGALRVIRTALYGVGVYDVPSFLGVVLVFALVTSFATTIPTLRIAKTDPAATLREE
jgi:ABC-type antimicrobial peptide transport system permease subunit